MSVNGEVENMNKSGMAFDRKDMGNFRGRYDISRECHTVLLNMTYSSKQYDIPRLCHTDEGRLG